jgi:CheY-like chemotaxis protein
MANTKILIIDDELDSVTFIETILKKEGHTIISAGDGLEGFEKAKKEIPDLIVLDVQMPKMDGFEVFDKLKKESSTKNIPVVMLTGIREKIGIGFNADDMKQFIGEKPNGYVEKPVSPQELLKVIKEIL